jgi:dipeptidase E
MKPIIKKAGMKKLFLTSYFADVFKLLPDFTKEEFKGKKITFIPTASIPEKVAIYVRTGKKALEKAGLQVDVMDISKASLKEISKKLETNNYIYITGGNTFFLLQELKRTGADKILAEQIHSGKLYIGESAGSVILSPNIEYVKGIDNCNKAPELKDYSALSIVDFYPVPHYKNFPFKKAVDKTIATYESRFQLIPFSNAQVIMVQGTNINIEHKHYKKDCIYAK